MITDESMSFGLSILNSSNGPLFALPDGEALFHHNTELPYSIFARQALIKPLLPDLNLNQGKNHLETA